MYADLFQTWVDQAGSEAETILHGMAAQRTRIGLPGISGIRLATPIVVRPVVAIDRRTSFSAKARLTEVRVHLSSVGLASDIDVRQVNLIGRRDPLPSAIR